MKRFRITTGDGHTLRLCYPTFEVAQKRYPDAEIVEDSDQSYVAYIQQMIDAAVKCQTMERNGSIVHVTTKYTGGRLHSAAQPGQYRRCVV